MQLALPRVHSKSEGEVDGIDVGMHEEDKFELVFKQKHEMVNTSPSDCFRIVHANVQSIELQDNMREKDLLGHTLMAIKVFPCLGGDIKRKRLLFGQDGQVFAISRETLLGQRKTLTMRKEYASTACCSCKCFHPTDVFCGCVPCSQIVRRHACSSDRDAA